MRLRLVLPLLLCFPTLVSAAVRFGPERGLVAPRTVIAEGSQVGTSVASSGTETLVAWVDVTMGRERIYVAALTDNGALVAGSQRRIGPAATAVTLTWTGQSYLALWSTSTGGVFALTLDRDRRPLGAARLVLPAVQIASTVEWAGSRGMFVYVEGNTYALALIDRDGTVIRDAIAIPAAEVNSARVFSDGQSFLAVWDVRTAQKADVFAARYTNEGELRDATPAHLATLGQFSGAWEAAFDGSRFALTLAEVGATTSTLRRYIIDPATLQSTVLPSVDMGPTFGVRVEWNGSRFVAYWLHNAQQAYELRTLSFSADGTGDAAPVTATTRQGSALQPSGAWSGTALMVAWAASGFDAPNSYDVYVAAIEGGADLTESEFPIALAPSWQSAPAAAGDGNQSLIVWREGLDHAAQLVAVHATAGVADSPAVYLSDHLLGRAQVVFTGAAYLVFWLEDTGNVPRLVMRRLGVTGVLLDAQETFITGTNTFAVAFNGTHALLAYPAPDGIEAVRFEPDGTLLDTRLAFPNVAGVVAMASNGSDFAVVWIEGNDWWQFPSPGLIDVYAALINDAGFVTTARIAVAATEANEHSATIASDGRDFVIAYVEDDDRVVTKKILREGSVSGHTVLGSGAGPFITGSEDGYIALWETDTRLRAARLDANGALVDGPSTVGTTGLGPMLPVLATGGGASGDLVYGRLHEDETYGAAMRIVLRRLGEGAGSTRGRAVRH